LLIVRTTSVVGSATRSGPGYPPVLRCVQNDKVTRLREVATARSEHGCKGEN
jgi:hypothetical protein